MEFAAVFFAVPAILISLTAGLIMFNPIKFPPRKNKLDQFSDAAVIVLAWGFFAGVIRLALYSMFR